MNKSIRLQKLKEKYEQETKKAEEEREEANRKFWRIVFFIFGITLFVIIIIMWTTMTFWYWFPAILFAFAFAIFLPTLALSAFIEEEDMKEKHKDSLYPWVSFFVVLGFVYLLFFSFTVVDLGIGFLWFFLLVAGVAGYFIGKRAREIYKRERKKYRDKMVTDGILFDEVTSNTKRKQRIIFT